MKTNFFLSRSKVIVLFTFVAFHLSAQDTLISVCEKYGVFYVQNYGEWVPASTASNDFFVFENKGSGAIVKIKKVQTSIQNAQEFNQQILFFINELRKSQEFVELRKQMVPIKLLEQKGAHFLKVKSRSDQTVKFIYDLTVDKKLFHFEVIEKKSGNEPSEETVKFLSFLSLQPVSAIEIVSANKKDKLLPDEKENGAKEKDDLSSFKKVKTNKNGNPTVDSKVKETKEETAKGKKDQNLPTNDINLSPADEIVKGNIPTLKFEISEPCKNLNQTAGAPWEEEGANKGTEPVPGGNDLSVPIIPDFKDLSNLAYNSAVSSSFELLRILYGPMPDKEYKQFESVWTPLFDYPDQKVIDYLNQLNPLVLQFLSLRESYARIVSDVQLLLLDASYAVEANEKVAWESIMAEAKINSLPLKSLEDRMKVLAGKIEKLGNPPNPNDIKCEARKRYNKMMAPEDQACISELTGIWIGYSEGYKDIEFYERQAECMLIYEMPMENPFSKNLICSIEAYMLTEEPRNQMGKFRYCDCNQPLIAEFSSFDLEKSLSQDKSTIQLTIDGINYYFKRATDRVLMQGTGLDEARVVELSSKVDAWEKELKSIDGFNNREEYESIERQKESCKSVIKRLRYKQKMIPLFHEVASQWLNDLPLTLTKWIAATGGDERLIFFRELINGKMGGQRESYTPTPTADEGESKPTVTDDEIEAQNRQEAIDYHSEMLALIRSDIDKDVNERSAIIDLMQKAKTPQEYKAQEDRLKMIERSIINKEANLQAEQDLVDSYKSGQLVHNRSVFDDVARNQFIQNIRENASRMDATRRISERIERQIQLLPEELRSETRARVLKNLDAQVIGSGDLEKAKKIASAINEQVQGYAEYDHAMAKEAEVNAEENKFYSDMAIMAVGAISTGFASVALAETYGAGTAMALYGTKMLGAVYGGTTGLVAGGPKEGINQAVSYWSPVGNAMVQFVDGYQNTGDTDTGDKLWNGIKNAGTGYLMGKAFELGTKLAVKGSFVALGKESILFKPLVQSPAERSKSMLDVLRTKQKSLNTEDEIATFKKLESELAKLKGKDPVLNGPAILKKELELQKLAAGLNSSYDAKWSLKYIQDPLTRSKFDRRVQKNYNEMIAGIIKTLESKGYVMKDIEFIQFRNHNSGGTSSMDLDLGPVIRGSKNEPLFFYKKGGSIADKEAFMNDAQKAMNDEYYKLFGISAKLSDMNLVTSRHPEAFASSRMLDRNINIASFTPGELASVGRVLEVKMTGITNNKMLTNTNKVQALCRESSKEIENFLLKKLQSDFDKAPKGSQQQKNIQEKIKYWESMLSKLKRIGTEENNAIKIMEANREIMLETGGKDVTAVVKDIIKSFGHKPK
ncbi:MAG: hypothetical protein IPN73_13925 [Saprospiraceae bacterium]|nr:hypothetical protein [Saprospiraceae bacterium]